MLRIFKYLDKKAWGYIVLALFFIVAQVGLEIMIPGFMSKITTLIETPGTTVSDVLVQGAFMLASAFGSLIAAIIVGLIGARLATRFAKKLRGEVFKKVDSFSLKEINDFSTASLITRTSNDITQIQMLITMGLQVVIRAPILAVWAISMIIGKSSEWTAITAISIVFLCIMIGIILYFALPRFKRVQMLTDKVTGVARENLTGMKVVRAFNAEKYQVNKFEGANNDLTNTHLFLGRIMAFMNPGMSLVMNVLSLSIYWIGAFILLELAIPDRLPVFSDMVVFSSYAMQVVMAFILMSMVFFILPRAAVSARRILEVLHTKPSIKNGTKEIKDIEEIRFDNVHFRYSPNAKDVLHNINLTIKKGETVAFIGSTGSGKSTLIQLIGRFYDTTQGQLLINGTNIKEYDLEKYIDLIGYVPQTNVLFTGTIASNIAFGQEEIDEERLAKAIDISQSREFIEKMEQKEQTDISQGGKNVSGGQKQRIAIARAIYKNPPVYIFDDSFSALDFSTDRKLRMAMKENLKDATVLLVGQRISTIQDADKIVVMDEGKIVGIGKHKELLKNCSVYLQIAQSQLSKGELGDE